MAKIVLAIFPSSRGLSFALFEGALPLHWGVKGTTPEKGAECTETKIENLISESKPDVIVLRRHTKRKALNGTRRRRITEAVRRLARDHGINVVQYTRTHIRTFFQTVGAKTRREIVERIIDRLPQFDFDRPAARRFWESEDRRMLIFDAVALVCTYYNEDTLPIIQF